VNPDNEKDRQCSFRVLVIDSCTPAPDKDAGSVVAFNSMVLLRDMGFQVTFIPEDNFLYIPYYTQLLQSNGIEVLFSPYTTNVFDHLKTIERNYDLVLLFRPNVAEKYIKLIRKYQAKAKIIFDTIDLHFLRMERERSLLLSKLSLSQINEIKKMELKNIKYSDATIVHSNEELMILKKLLIKQEYAKVEFFPYVMDVPGKSKDFSFREGIVFVGGYSHMPNIDAVEFFVKKVFPEVKKYLPDVIFYIVGSNPPPKFKNLESDSVKVVGYVKDLDSFMNNRKVSVAPLRYGAGIKGKIASAMAVGLPVVATSIAIEGMGLQQNENIFVADNPKDIAKSISDLYLKKYQWNKISRNGIKFAQLNWGYEAAWARLSKILLNLDFKKINEDKKRL